MRVIFTMVDMQENYLKKQALPLCGNKDIVFNQIEIISRKNRKIETRTISFKNIKNLAGPLKKKKVKLDINHIISKRKNFSII